MIFTWKIIKWTNTCFEAREQNIIGDLRVGFLTWVSKQPPKRGSLTNALKKNYHNFKEIFTP